MAKVTMYDVCGKLGLPAPSGKRDINVLCPRCGKRASERKLNISLEKDVFYCNKCGFTGNPISLYSELRGIPYEQAFTELKSGSAPVAAPKPVIEPEKPLAPIAVRDRVYREMLKHLSLRDDHRADLVRRGLSEADILRNGYKSVPGADYAQGIAAAIARMVEPDGVPGFYRMPDGRWTFETRFGGFFIPYRDHLGRIEGMQIRQFSDPERKYIWFSSKSRKDGTGAEVFVHISGYAQETMVLTEGGLKADVIRALGHTSVIAVPGVNSLRCLPEVIVPLKAQGLNKVLICYDMDIYDKKGVQRGFNALVKMLIGLGIEVEQKTWDPAFKGLDDYLLARHKAH